jgi:hypothetical protein
VQVLHKMRDTYLVHRKSFPKYETRILCRDTQRDTYMSSETPILSIIRCETPILSCAS